MVQLDHTFVQHKKGLQGIKHGCREDKVLYLTSQQRKTEEQKELGEKKENPHNSLNYTCVLSVITTSSFNAKF